MKVGLFAASLLLTSGLVSVVHAATITMSPPDPQNKPAAKVQPSVQPPPAPPKIQPPVQVQATPPQPQAKPSAAAPTVVEPAPKVIATPAAPPAQQPKTQAAVQTKPDCPCDCPRNRKANRNATVRSAPRYARGDDYRYEAAAPFHWHGPWRAVRNGAFIPGPMAYGPGYEVEGLRIDDLGWTGGVGTASDGGGGGGYGQAYFANGGSVENGPTYNSYGQSFQYNPSQAGPFQPRLMGGYAPPSR